MPFALKSVRASGFRARSARNWLPYKAFVAGALIFTAFASSSAQAQNCTAFPGILSLDGIPLVDVGDLKSAFGGAIAGATSIAATINAANTAFLTHSTAFVSAPASPPPDSQGGGVWIRGIGGESTTKSSQSISANLVVPLDALGFPGQTLSASPSGNCNTTFKQNFGGVQFGT